MARTTMFPSILPSGDDFVDDSYSEQELDRMSGHELQSLAAKHPTDDVHGRMKADDIREGLVGETRIVVE